MVFNCIFKTTFRGLFFFLLFFALFALPLHAGVMYGLKLKNVSIDGNAGGTYSAFKILHYTFPDTTTSVASSSFTEMFSILQGGSAETLGEVVIVPPKLAADPTFSSGDYWEGGFYYNTSTNKHRANTGGGTWTDMY